MKNKIWRICANNHHHHHHQVVPLARISLTFSRHFSQSFIAFGRSSGLHPVSLQSCCMYVRAGHPAFAWPYAGVHRSTSLMSSSLLFQQCPACLVRLTCIVFVMGGKWPYSWCLVGCWRQDLLNIALNNQHIQWKRKKDMITCWKTYRNDRVYVFTQPFNNVQDVTQGQFLSEEKFV